MSWKRFIDNISTYIHRFSTENSECIVHSFAWRFSFFLPLSFLSLLDVEISVYVPVLHNCWKFADNWSIKIETKSNVYNLSEKKDIDK